jgi:hypothetical protein
MSPLNQPTIKLRHFNELLHSHHFSSYRFFGSERCGFCPCTAYCLGGEKQIAAPPYSITLNLNGQDPAQGIVRFLREHPCDLVVMATHGRDGIDHWLKGSVSEDVFGRFAIPTLFVTHGARGFVSQVSGDIRLRRVLIPVD